MTRNIELIALIRVFLLGGTIVVPGLPPLLREHGTHIWEMELWFAAALLIMLVPSGLAADRFGERRTIITGCLLMILGQAVYTLAASYLGFIIAEVLVGAGLGCIFGSDESLLRRSLKEGDGHFEFVARWNRVVLLQILATSFGFLLGEISMRIWSRLPPTPA